MFKLPGSTIQCDGKTDTEVGKLRGSVFTSVRVSIDASITKRNEMVLLVLLWVDFQDC